MIKNVNNTEVQYKLTADGAGPLQPPAFPLV